MPPHLALDPLDAVQRAARPAWLLAPVTALSVACEFWVLLLVATATYAWLEADVRSVLRRVLPLAAGLGAGVALVALAGRIGVAAGWGVRAIPSGHALWAATFAAYTWRSYGRRAGLLAALLPLSGGAARIYLGSNGLASVVAGWVIGVAIGQLAHWAAARLDRLAKVA